MNSEIQYYNSQVLTRDPDYDNGDVPFAIIRKRNSTPVWQSGLDSALIKTNGILISLQIEEHPEEIDVFTDITARKKGDEALQLLHENLKKIASIAHRPVVHRGIPTNDAATQLFIRHSGYLKQAGNEWKYTIPSA